MSGKRNIQTTKVVNSEMVNSLAWCLDLHGMRCWIKTGIQRKCAPMSTSHNLIKEKFCLSSVIMLVTETQF